MVSENNPQAAKLLALSSSPLHFCARRERVLKGRRQYELLGQGTPKKEMVEQATQGSRWVRAGRVVVDTSMGDAIPAAAFTPAQIAAPTGVTPSAKHRTQALSTVRGEEDRTRMNRQGRQTQLAGSYFPATYCQGSGPHTRS